MYRKIQPQVFFMTKTIRYCIHCGREIGESLFCANPDCGGIPNFYRDVPSPEPRTAQGPLKARDQNGERTAGRSQGMSTLSGELDEDRRTIRFQAAPVALLRATVHPFEEHLIYPGATEVGARKPAKIIIDRPEVSSRHARLDCRQGSGGRWDISIVDQGSTNGTYVNGKQIERQGLAPGDRVMFANVEYELKLIPKKEDPRVTIEM